MSAGAIGWTAVPVNKTCTDIIIPYRRQKNWEFWCLLSSDRHWDNIKSDHELQIAHLKDAKERGAVVIDNGDFFCAMQGKFDKRSDKSSLRIEHKEGDYLDALVETASDFFAPYAHLFAIIGEGNHETSIRDRHGTNLIGSLCTLLKVQSGHKIIHAPYQSWVRFKFVRDDASKKATTVNMKRNHGYGGGGPVTKGVIQTNRRATYLPNAHIVVTGHIHEEWYLPITREILSDAGNSYLEKQYHISVTTYKEEYLQGEGWHTQRGGPPKPVGATWLRFYYNHRKDTISYYPVPAE